MMVYNNTVRDYFFSPRHIGVLDINQDFVVVFKNNQKGQGDIEFYMQCSPESVIQKVCFKTNGNPYLIAALEWLCRQLEGQSVDKMFFLGHEALIKELGIPRLHYPLAVRVMQVLKESLTLMNQKLAYL
jgi:nitrogen fixation NifU-like protein